MTTALRIWLRLLVIFVVVGSLSAFIVLAPTVDDGSPLQLTNFCNISRDLYETNYSSNRTFLPLLFPVAASSDRTIWVTGDRPWITVWDSSGRIVRSFESGWERKDDWRHMVCSLALSADQRLLAAGYEDGGVKLWDFQTGTLLSILSPGDSEAVRCLVMSHDDSWLFSAGSKDGAITVWNLKTMKRHAALRSHSSAVVALACSPVDHRLASMSADGLIILWDRERAEAAASMRHQTSEGYRSLAFSPDGMRLASLAGLSKTGGSIKIWDPATSNEEVTIDEPNETTLKSMTFLDHGAVLAAVGEWRRRGDRKGIILLYDRNGTELYRQESGKFGTSTPVILSGPDPRELAIVDHSGDVTFWIYRDR